MERHSANAGTLAQWLAQHPSVERVYYPGLPSHPQYALAQRQMRHAGGIISCVLRGDAEQVAQRIGRLRLFTRPRAWRRREPGMPALQHDPLLDPLAQRLTRGIVPQLIRLSVGIEDVADLQADLAQALD
ncbi:PLP-dependent transferase [Edwardsiella anguillarum]|nr:PLP-dependent transferase [Edwardsiella anguillarum]